MTARHTAQIRLPPRSRTKLQFAREAKGDQDQVIEITWLLVWKTGDIRTATVNW
ncbi:MAG: hypothetical protein WCA23_08400 [Stellaceae bacterium]